MAAYNYRLFQVVCDASVADDFEAAKTEWAVVGMHPDQDQVCVCGKTDILYCYTIRNRRNDRVLYPIGSKCILKFKEPTMDDAMNALRLAEARAQRAERAQERRERVAEETRAQEQRRLEEQEARDLLAYADARDRTRMDSLRDQIMVGGKYRSLSFARICRMDPGYIHFLRRHGYEQEYLEIVEYWDLCAKHA